MPCKPQALPISLTPELELQAQVTIPTFSLPSGAQTYIQRTASTLPTEHLPSPPNPTLNVKAQIKVRG